MIISSAQLYAYKIPLDRLLPVGKQRIETRSGLVLSVEATQVAEDEHNEANTRSEQVEISPLSGIDIDGCPLQGFSKESLQLVSDKLESMLDAFIGKPIAHLLDAAETSLYPSLAFGLSLLHAKLAGQLDGHSLPLRNLKSVPLIYRAADEGTETLNERIRSLPLHTHSVKVKVAQTSLEEEIRLVHQVLAIRPDLKLRLDANRGFTLEQAIEFAACIPLASVEYIEEPCINHQDNSALFNAIEIPWALDETLNDPSYQFSMQPGLTALVIKPMLLGTIDRLQALQSQADHHGVRTILSSGLEGSLGIEALAKLSRIITPDELPGLDTLGAFSQDLLIDSGKERRLTLNQLTEIKSAK
ncbi:o-succinylbenzoate synthase [Shewanella sp. UCD-KL12]|uniref:o-succinylbenzoate synthase n=1 Tax=Shewanella sp. UCD-KL12 TaxID=1917163 RepID=UPI000970BFDE|nr:o-succinylbenzoate synthase [Shewanella sp. UCD-KL12]